MKNNGNIRTVDALIPQPKLIKEAADIITAGGIVCFPTKCLYGLGVDACDVTAVDSIFRIKNRPVQKPILVLVKDSLSLERIVTHIPVNAQKIMKHFWPGDVTLVFDAVATLPENLTAGSGKVGVRIPEHPVPKALLEALDRPITGTSANLSSQRGCNAIADLHPDVVQKMDLILDAGTLLGGRGSTVIDVTQTPPIIYREGCIPAKQILEIL